MNMLRCVMEMPIVFRVIPSMAIPSEIISSVIIPSLSFRQLKTQVEQTTKLEYD